MNLISNQYYEDGAYIGVIDIDKLKELSLSMPVFMNTDIYYFKGKPYRIFSESKMKISELWIDVVIYEALYDCPDGKYWVREKGQFFKLFTHVNELT
jgi:hypothetical protein